MITKKRSTVLPIYLVGLTWLLFGLFFSLHAATDYLLCGTLSALVFVVGKGLFPNKVYQTAAPKSESEPQSAPKSTGSPELDALIKERDRAVSEMRRLNGNIADEKISRQIDHLETVTTKIIDLVVAQPKKLPQIQRFLNYYLPTTLKLLNAYDRMDSAGITGENITATKERVEGMMDTIALAFDRQLDALFGDEALDISTDITVMEQMLTQEGLGGLTL